MAKVKNLGQCALSRFSSMTAAALKFTHVDLKAMRHKRVEGRHPEEPPEFLAEALLAYVETLHPADDLAGSMERVTERTRNRLLSLADLP